MFVSRPPRSKHAAVAIISAPILAPQGQEHVESPVGGQVIIPKQHLSTATMDLSNLDPETRSLVIRLHLEDVHAIQASSQNQKGKRRLGETDDFEAGLDAYKTELASAAQSFADHAICESIDRAVRSDAELIQLSLREEEQSARDREMALRSSQGGSRGAVSTTRSMCTHPAPTSASEDLVKRFQDLRCDLADEGEDASGQPVSSAWAARRRQPVSSSEPRQRTKVCIACRDRQYDADVAACPCSHYYCRGCLDSLFRASLTDETLFPPRCCGQNIPPDVYRGLVDDAQFIGTFRAKKIEFETPNRTYCHEPTCSTFVPPQSIAGDVATCVRCRSQTCTICKARAHQGSDCPQDPALQETLRLAAEQGWQRCGSCQSVVELQHGCNHMSEYLRSNQFHLADLSRLALTPLLACSLSLRIPVLLCLRAAMEDLQLLTMGRRAASFPGQRHCRS